MKEQKLKNFANDVVMFEAVMAEIEKVFTKKKADADVHVLASVTLSLYALEDAKKVLMNYKNYSGEELKTGGQVGL